MIRLPIRFPTAVVAIIAAPLLALLTIQGTATAIAVSPSPTGQVEYAIAYEDNCNGSVEVAIGNATPDSITISVNGAEVSIEPQGFGHFLVPAAEDGKTKVKLKVLLGKGKPDKADHTWVKPKVCIGGTPSASASATPSTPPSSAAPSVSPSASQPPGPQLALTGYNVGMVSAVGLGSLSLGVMLFLVGRRRRHTVS